MKPTLVAQPPVPHLRHHSRLHTCELIDDINDDDRDKYWSALATAPNSASAVAKEASKFAKLSCWSSLKPCGF